MIVLVAMGIDDHPGASDDADEHDPRWRVTPTKIVVTGILLVAIVIPLLTSTYSRVTPRLFGFPFFYWYQFIWVFVAAGCCYLSYLLLRREYRQYQLRTGQSSSDPDRATGDGPTDSGKEV